MDFPSIQAYIIAAVVFIPADLKSHFHPLAGPEFFQKCDLIFDELHFDILRIAVVATGYDKFALREAAAKRHNVHDDLDGPFDFVAHCD